MRLILRFIPLLFFASALTAQPVNDDCDGVIDLGTLPACTEDVYDNVGATASDIGFGNIPACFNGGSVQRDVFFSFTTTADLTDVTITLTGVTDGANGSILNPQINVYRGLCAFDNLADLGFCVSAADGEATAQVDILGLSPNTTYFIRVNDYSATGTPNSGDFTLCIDEYVPAINIGDSPGTSACFGTLYDSGGPEEDYGNGENNTFTITPANLFECLELEIQSFNIENNFDFLNVYAGPNTGSPLIASFTGASLDPIQLQASTTSVTIEFTSDGSATQAGFELTWNCSPIACDGSSIDNPTVINGLPFEDDGYTTCGAIATFAESPCGTAPFLNGEEFVFAYDSPGGFCATVSVTDAAPGTGLIILDGPPNDPETSCVGISETGTIQGANFEDAGTYYIVVARANGCTDFGLSITESDCNLEPSLENALCNPLNGCISPDALPSVFVFNQGFEDIAFNQGLNDGCWFNTGSTQPNYYWFTIEAQADGPFGFTVQADNPAEASDIDFQVWGPFTREQTCEDPDFVVNFIENNQPIRSSYAGGADPTGLASIHPVTGIEVLDEYDCAPDPNGNGDDFCRVIDCQEGEIYAVLINDWGDDIASGAISIDWIASDPDVLAPATANIAVNDTAICSGEGVALLVESSVSDITWLKDTATLSCLDCLDPIATPEETTNYVAIIDAVCYQDTVEVIVEVYDVDAGPDVTVCRNEEIEIIAGSNFLDATYEWDAPTGVTLSCTNCPNPTISADAPGDYVLTVTLFANGCTLEDQMTMTVLPQEAAQYEISDDLEICLGETVSIGGPGIAGVDITWSSSPEGFVSAQSNPAVTPDTTTRYYISAMNQECPLPTIDSVDVRVFIPPTITVASDTAVCQGDSLILGNTMLQSGVVYQWSGPSIIDNPANPNTLIFPQEEGTYTLTATRGACVETATVDVTITPIAIEVLAEDTLRICRGVDVVDLSASITPAAETPIWTSTQPGFDTLVAANITVSPESVATYYAEVAVSGSCFRIDSVVVLVDSLPSDLSLAPLDTTICQGEIITLQSPIYEPGDFPGIDFQWGPQSGLETPDSLYNMILTGQDTIDYFRVSTLGVCEDTAFARVNVNRVPIITISPMDTTICPGDQVQFQVEVNGTATEQGWETNADQLSCDDCLDPTTLPLGNTTSFSYKATNGECPSEVSVQVEVLPTPPFELEGDMAICLGESITLIQGTDPDAVYTWTSTDPNFGTVADGALNITPTESHTYYVAATYGICEPVVDSVLVEVIGGVVIDIVPNDFIICPGDSTDINVAAIGGSSSDSYEWSGSDGSTFSGRSITVSPADSTVYVLNYISGGGCTELTDSVLIEVEDIVDLQDITITPDTVYVEGDDVALQAIYETTFDPANLTFTWRQVGPDSTFVIATGAGLDVIDYTLDNPGEYGLQVEITTAVGCTYILTIPVEVQEIKVNMPNAFTPNGDDTNDFFNFLISANPDKIEILEFKIFNRWGQVVYDNDTPETGWDGRFNGKDQPSEVYYYRVQLARPNGFELGTFQGDLTLAR